jgi:stearoyl-CoA desaturase (delta-9 desaturase)
MEATAPTSSRSIRARVVSWFDSWSRTPEALAHPNPERTDWVRSIPFLVMHLACVAIVWVGWSPVAVGTAVGLYLARMFFLTGFYHRYFSHRTFKTSRAGQFAMALAGATAVQRGPLWWAAHHRHHHQHSDEEEDVHSPVRHGFWRSHMGWLMTRKCFPTELHRVRDLAKYPELVFLDRFDTLVPVALAGLLFGVGALLEAVAPGLGTNGWQMLVWGFFVSTTFLFHAACTINSLSHVFGTRPYDTKDSSRNNPLLALLTLGEGWHNNHHHYPHSTRQGFRWWQVDLTYYALVTLSWLGLVWDLKPPRPESAATPSA